MEFERERTQSFVGLCVLGGIFSEGIDLKEERLEGAIIVGTGLPMVCTEQEILKKYFEEQGENGYDYAYQYPGMNKVMQGGGAGNPHRRGSGRDSSSGRSFSQAGGSANVSQRVVRIWAGHEADGGILAGTVLEGFYSMSINCRAA